MFSFGGGFVGDSGLPPSSVTDLFNGFNRVTGDSYTGGPTTVLDNTGALVTAPVNRMGIEGGRLSYNLAEGATLGAERLTNGGFDTSLTGWSTSGTWAWDSGAAKHNPGTINSLYTSIGGVVVKDKTYKTVLVVSGRTAGSVFMQFGSTQPLTARTTNGTFEQQVMCTASDANPSVYLVPSSDFDGRVELASIGEVIPVWLPYASNGSPIASSQSVRTRRGVVAKYASTFRGFLNERGGTNRLLCRKHNPSDLTNVSIVGDAAATLTLADMTAKLTEAKLAGVCTNGKVYKVDNSAGVALVRAFFSPEFGNVNPQALSVYVMGDGYLNRSGSNSPANVVFSSTGFVRVGLVVTPNSTTDQMVVGVLPGKVAYFILPQLEEGAFVTSVIPGDTLATSVRNPSVYNRPAEGRLRPNTQGIAVRVFPSAAGQTGVLWSTRVDANNYAQISATPTTLIFSKTIAGVTTSAMVNYTHAKDTPFIAMAHQDPVGGMKVRAKQDGGAWTAYGTNASVTDMPIGTGYSKGHLNGTSHFSGNFPYVELVQAGLSPFETASQ